METTRNLRIGPVPCFKFWAAFAVSLPALLAGASSGSGNSSVARQFRGPGIVNHPLGVTVPDGMTIPESWPLDKSGRLSCFTCHSSVPPPRSSSGPHLRDWDDQTRGSTRTFCSRCHTERTDGSPSAIHWTALEVAHVREEQDQRIRGGSTDSESRRCLSCHDGVIAGDSSGRHGAGRTRAIGANNGADHPVGVVYGRLRPGEGPPARLRHQGTLPKQIRLPEGKVSCVSCHDLYSRTPAHLTVTNEGSALCIACHALD